MKILVEVFDPAMCCSTGVCGPDVDPRLVHFAADLDYLKSQGVDVQRHNLAHEPGHFVRVAAIKNLLASKGTAALPAIVVNGKLVRSGCYPNRSELAVAAGLAVPASASGPAATAGSSPGGCGCSAASKPVTISVAAARENSCCGGS